MQHLSRRLLVLGFVMLNLALGANTALAAYKHEAAYDPATGKWIVVCTSCLIWNCNCTPPAVE